jgi:tetratricopeptide (TPR) repeat protein
MNNLVRRFSFLLTIVFAAGIAVMPAVAAAPNGSRPHAPSAELQLQQANALWEKVHQATSAQGRLEATRATWECLAAIPDVWPEDMNAVVQSGVMRYELAMESQSTETAIESLLPISDLARKTTLAPGVERRLGEAYTIVGDRANAEKHFLQAEALLNTETNVVEASALLRSVADFYARQKNFAEAIKRLDRGAQLRDQSLVTQMQFRLSSAREALNLPVESRSETAIRELAAVDELIATSRSKSLSAPEAASTESYAHEAGQLRERLSRE